MPITDCPIISSGEDFCNVYLPIKIINPHTNKSTSTMGLIDTGADECAIPAYIAEKLGHDIKAGKSKGVITGNGEAYAYKHTTKFEIYHPITGKLLYTIHDTPVDCLPKLTTVLLGVNNFLIRFILKIDYPKRTFSLKFPEK